MHLQKCALSLWFLKSSMFGHVSKLLPNVLIRAHVCVHTCATKIGALLLMGWKCTSVGASTFEELEFWRSVTSKFEILKNCDVKIWEIRILVLGYCKPASQVHYAAAKKNMFLVPESSCSIPAGHWARRNLCLSRDWTDACGWSLVP